MNYKEVAIDLKKSKKGQRKKAVRLLRKLGYNVIKRKNAWAYEFNVPRYFDSRNSFEYDISGANRKMLTLPEDWGKFVAAVTPKLKVGDWVKVLECVSEPEKIGTVTKVKSISGNHISLKGFRYPWGLDAISKGFLRLATPKEIKEAEKPVWNYPCYGKSEITGAVVYFEAEGEGVVVSNKTNYVVGYTSSCWSMPLFTPCEIQTILK